MSSKRERRWWTEEEDHILKVGVESQIKQVGNVNSLMSWNEIAALLPRRTNKDCRKRWYKVRSDFIKGAWSHEEDRKLEQAVQRYGLKMRQEVAARIEARPKAYPWQPEEDAKLLQAMDKHGNKWKMIGTLDLPNRSSHDIRNRSVVLSRREKRLSRKDLDMSQDQPASQPGSRNKAANGKPQSHDYEDEDEEEDFVTECEDDDICDDYDDSGVSVASSYSQLQSPTLDMHMDSGFTSEATSPRSMQAIFTQEDSKMATTDDPDWNGLAMLQEQLLKTDQLQHLQHLQQMQATPPSTPISSAWYGLSGASDAVTQPTNGYASYPPMNVMPYPSIASNSMTDEGYLAMFDSYLQAPNVGTIGYQPQMNHDWIYEVGYRADSYGG
ncbi:Transcriptional regulator [Apiospora kogelbergensis]|uniref:Transcriptional regulator n=1 Tax=Apiospora kogelbergensis TaxID=1337665 RepID=A0AAW0QQ72_9PEZI